MDQRFLTFDALLRQALTRPEVEEELRRRYLTEAAVLVSDFTGMVKRTDAEGIIYALALARSVEDLMEPAFVEAGGEVIKRVADTVFVVFPEPKAALGAALEAQRRVHAFNHTRSGHLGDGSRNEPIHACMGLGWGEALVIPGQNLYGAEVNRAFVLGEDVANADEVLATDAFLASLGGLPEGVGSFKAPEPRTEEAGFSFHVVRDYRAHG